LGAKVAGCRGLFVISCQSSLRRSRPAWFRPSSGATMNNYAKAAIVVALLVTASLLAQWEPAI
jgi:hypothetical protein